MLTHTTLDGFAIAQTATPGGGSGSVSISWELLLLVSIVGTVALGVTWMLTSGKKGSD